MVVAHEWLVRRGVVSADDAVWFVEYDVRCHGSFARAFARCDADTECRPADFMAMGGGEGQLSLRTYAADPGWCWWGGLEGEIAKVPNERRVGAFFPLVRISGRMARLLRANFGRSTGFCEVYVPTLCATTDGFVASPLPADAVGQFRYRPVIEDFDALVAGTPADGRFFHPAK
jgi:hypothetical protein